MTLKELIEKKRQALAGKLAARKAHTDAIAAVRTACDKESRDPSEAEATQVREATEAIRALDIEIAGPAAEIEGLEAELRADEEADRLASRSTSTGVRGTAYDDVARVGRDERTYRADQDPKGKLFLSDVARQFASNALDASERLSRHMREEQVERGDQIDRAANTGAFTGLVVPQYLTDLFAPLARAGRPFADACRHHDLPETGMTAYIGKVTTGTTADEQANEGDLVAEQDIDDTLIPIPIRTVAGSESVSRQALERGIGVEDVTLQDLFEAHATKLDNQLLNRAGNGLSAVATSIAYTDATPTAVELYPKLLAAPASVEAALLNQSQGDVVAVMNSRRWYWLQSQLTSTWPMFGQQGIPNQLVGVDLGKKYGSGFRGVLPSGVAVVVDNNVATNLGAGTNEDEVYFGAQSELHLWEDPNAPMLIRAEQNQAKRLLVDLVVYSYVAHLFNRRAHAQKIAGTGLTAPVF